MTKHTIEIEGLPEGWEAVAYRKPVFGEYYFYNDDIQQGRTGSGQFLIVQKTKPRRIDIYDRELELLINRTSNSSKREVSELHEKLIKIRREIKEE